MREIGRSVTKHGNAARASGAKFRRFCDKLHVQP
uniref:Uncharacterized protein n=1 Tax=mine drainage metagenome TaxID=410659 RepID=E6PTZ1_9ZZZZ